MSELYEFERSGTTYRYANGNTDVDFGGNTYTATTISCDRIPVTTEVFKASFSLSLPVNNELVVDILNNFTGNVTTLKIYRDEVLWWTGRVTNARITKNKSTLKCESIFSSIRRAGLKQAFETSCRHTLYSDDCGADIATYTAYNCDVSDVNGNVITLPDAAGDDENYKLGVMKKGDEMTTILEKNGTEFTVIKNIGIVAGDTVDISWGCPHTRYECMNRFDNVINFGGFPHIPETNIFEVGIV